jgi:hypothetical protein
MDRPDARALVDVPYAAFWAPDICDASPARMLRRTVTGTSPANAPVLRR